jgi:RHS repeat-associated protein
VGFSVIRDTTPPSLTLAALVQGEVHVTWSATDPDSGVDASTCLLEVREDEGAWQTFSTECGGDDTHDGQPGHTYTFRLAAADNVGNAASLEVQAVFPYVKKYYYANGQRVAMRQEGVVYYIHTDHLGSTSLTTDQNQQVEARQVYYPYGTPRWSQGTLPTDYTFTGQRDEAGIGLMHYGARFYSPRLGRFVSADTIVPNPMSPQNFNRYSYASNNPLGYRDPTGHQNWDAVNEYFMGIAYQIGANNWEAFGVSSVAAVRAGAEEVAQEHSDSMAFEVGRLCGSLGTALQGLGEIGGGITAAEAGGTVSGTGVGALAGVPVAGAGVAVAAHGAVLVGQSVGQASLSAGRLIQMASGRKPPRRPIDGRPQHPGTSPEHDAFGTQRAKEIEKNNPTVRWNQGLVDPEGNTASRLRPDIQYIEDGKVFIEEIQSPNQPLRELIRKEKHYRDALGDYFGGYRIRGKEEYLP